MRSAALRIQPIQALIGAYPELALLGSGQPEHTQTPALRLDRSRLIDHLDEAFELAAGQGQPL